MNVHKGMFGPPGSERRVKPHIRGQNMPFGAGDCSGLALVHLFFHTNQGFPGKTGHLGGLV